MTIKTQVNSPEGNGNEFDLKNVGFSNRSARINATSGEFCRVKLVKEDSSGTRRYVTHEDVRSKKERRKAMANMQRSYVDSPAHKGEYSFVTKPCPDNCVDK